MHRVLFAQYYNWQEFTFPQEQLQEGPSAFCDPSYVSHGDKKPHLIQQRELNYLVRDLYISKQEAELVGSRRRKWYLLARETRIFLFRKRQEKLCGYSDVHRLFEELRFLHDDE